jgi:hypothetical protein
MDHPLYDIRMKYERSGVKDINGLNRDVMRYFDEIQKPSEYSLNILAGIYDFIAENIEREQYKHYTRDQWEDLERQYVYRADFTQMDLYDMLISQLERGKITREQYRKERSKFKPCKHRFCLNYFVPRSRKHRFCCEDCRKRENDALKQFEITSQIYAAGTYLPPSAYKDNRQREKDQNYREYERLFEDPEIIKEGYAGKRDRVTEERKHREWRINKEEEKYKNVVGIVRTSVLETALNIDKKGDKPVKILAKTE